MAILAPELSIGGLTALLCAIIAMLIPLTIWVFCTCERQKSDRWFRGARTSHSGRGPTRRDPEKREPVFREDHAPPVQGGGHMQTPFASRPACKKSRDASLYGGRLSIARVVVSIALVLVTLVIALAQSGGDTAARKSVGPAACASSMPRS
jgi:hypothetical protein